MPRLEEKSYRFGSFEFDMRSGCLRRDGAAVQLRPKSFDVLACLVQRHGRLVTKNELIETVWPNVIVTDNSLVQCIKEVRQALGDDSQIMIETVAKRGYIFTPAIVEADNDEVPATRPAPIASAQSGHAVLIGEPSRRLRYAGLGGAVAVLLIAGGIWWEIQPTAPPLRGDVSRTDRSAEDRLSIAVLPFDIFGETAQDYFSIGISEDIAAALGRFPDLAVASPKVVSRFRSAGVSAEDIQRQLNVRYIVEGGARRSADGIRITVRLTDLPRGILLWSESYEALATDVFKIQDDIIIRIAGALSVRISKLEQGRAASRPESSMEAYDFVLRGRELLTRLSRTAYSQARAMFERAIALDPQNGAAHVGLGRIDLSAVALGWTADAESALGRAEELARIAISIDEFNPAAHVLLGRTYARMGKYEQAVETLQRAVALNPSDPDSYAGLGDALLWDGNIAEAIKALETATSIDPRLSAEDLFSLGAAYFLAGRTSDTTRVFERITNRKEGNPFIYAMLAATYAESGRDADARWAVAEVRRLNPFFDTARFGSLFRNAGHRQRLTTALTKAGL